MLTYIDLFCGAGGFSLGFDAQGFKNIFSNDIEKSYCETYQHNFPHHHLIQKDIATLTSDEIKTLVNGQKIDVIIGGPPCQGFSMAGNIGRKFVDDPRNSLFKEFARMVEIVQPDFFVMENVARLFTHQQGATREEILNIFDDLGYKTVVKVVNAADFGVPQMRYRVLFIGNKIGKTVTFPEKNNQYQTVGNTLNTYPALREGEISTLPNHKAMNHSAQMLEKMSYVQDGGDRQQIPEDLRPKTGDIRKYIRYKSTEPSICVTGDMRKVFHYQQNRALTVRELAALQSFPDCFVFKGTSLSQQQQVGNAVPPLMAEGIAKIILNLID